MILIANDEGRCGVNKSFELLKANKDGLRAIIEGIKLVEENTDIRTVGKGGWPDVTGHVTLDAAVMDGDSLKTGAVGALEGFLNPVEVAYEVFKRLNHELLVGEGANRFAAEIGALRSNNLIESAETAWRSHIEKYLTKEQGEKFPHIPLIELSKKAIDPEKIFDTTVYLSRDHLNKVSSATSTSGWAWRYPGRLGDSPIIGAGSYADSRYGAAACTHTGEMAIRCSTARSIVLYQKMGMSVEEAVYEAANDLKGLKHGYLDELTLHAIDAKDNYKVISFRGSEPVYYWVWKTGMEKPVKEQAEYLD